MINSFLTQVADLISRECYVVEMGIFAECDQLVRDNVRRYFGNAYAQAWWRIVIPSKSTKFKALFGLTSASVSRRFCRRCAAPRRSAHE